MTNKTLSILIATFGLVVAAGLLFGALKFYHTIKELSQQNPSIITPKDTLRVNPGNDTLTEGIASMNQQIAEHLYHKNNEEMKRKQMLLHEAVTTFIYFLDSVRDAGKFNDNTLTEMKNMVNKTNLSFRAALFEVKDADQIKELNAFIIVNENKLENTIFECFSDKKETPGHCFDKIKHEALLIESIILEKNFKQLKT